MVTLLAGISSYIQAAWVALHSFSPSNSRVIQAVPASPVSTGRGCVWDARQIPFILHQGDNFILSTVLSGSTAINQQIIHLPLLPSRHFPLQRKDDSPSTNQRAAQIITHLRPPPLFLICTFDKCCLLFTLIAGSFHHNFMFVSCRFFFWFFFTEPRREL